MSFETKHLVAFVLMIAFGSAGFVAMLISQRMRDIMLFVFIVGTVLMERMNIMLFGQFWYRGTSRGFELSAIDFIPLALLVVNIVLPRYERGRFFWPAGFGMMLLYFLYCCGSVATAFPQHYGQWELAKMFRGMLVLLSIAIFVRTRRELSVVVLAIGSTVIMESLNAIEQRFLKGAIRPHGTLVHANTLSTYLCTVAPLLVASALSNWPKWLRWFSGVAFGFAAIAEVLTLSRLGIPVFALVSAGTAVMCSTWKLTLRRVGVIGLTAMAGCLLLLMTWDSLKARYMQGDIRREFTQEGAVETRGVYWRMAFLILQDHPYGVGLNNWSYYIGKSYGRELGYPYNDYDDFKWIPTEEEARTTLLPPAADSLPALTLGELGKFGFALLLLVFFRWFQMGAVFLRGRLNPDPMHRLGIGLLFSALGLFGQSVTEWTYRQTAVMFTFHVLMGTLASLYYVRKKVRVAERKQARAEAEEDVIDINPVPLPSAAARVVK